MRKLSIKKQLEILALARETKSKGINTGMCACLDYAHKILCPKRHERFYLNNNPNEIIPLFTPGNVRRLSIEYGFIPPFDDVTYGLFWWDMHDLEVRLKVFDALITELKKQL